jgi:hypothetical protein
LNSLLFSRFFSGNPLSLGFLLSLFDFSRSLLLFFLNLFSLSLFFCLSLCFFLFLDLLGSYFNLELSI